MRYLRVIPACLLLIVVLDACQAIPEGPPPQTMIPGSTPQSTYTETVTSESIPESTQAQPSNPLLTPEDTEMAPVITPDAAAQTIVDLVKADLAQKLSIPAEQITLTEVKAVVWRDASLGCPKPGIDYIQMETPGYRIVLEASGRTYNYHTDQVKRFVQCNTPS